MYIKIYETEESVLVAVCDRDLIGNTYRDSGLKLEVTEEFYKGELVDADLVQTALLEATTANIVGEQSVDAAISCGAVDPESVIVISGVPHAQMFRV
jgi:hypothetical protein